MKKIVLLAFVLFLLLMTTIAYASNVLAWSNGGYSDDPSNPDYGTHDWIAEHALDWLPEREKQYIMDNLATYLYGTELPDNPAGIGDTTKHHIYYWSNESLQDDSSAVRAYEEYNNTLNFLKLRDLANASKTAGIMSHYIVDMAVFGHVMGAGTDWGAETHHSDYENYVNQRTDSYDDEFNVYLSFDGELRIISAYNAAKELAYDITFDVDGDLTCLWMDQNYNWSDPVFKNRCGESLNLAVNYLADVLHTLYSEVAPVHNIDTGMDYLTIQKAINAPETLDGHTILVDAGIYHEHVFINKSISLIGENRSSTIIDGNGTGNVISIYSDFVTVRGFTIQNSGFFVGLPGGIEIGASNCTIDNNIITFNKGGISLLWGGNHTITNNTISSNYYGIYIVYSVNNKIFHNYFLNNTNQVYITGAINTWDNGYPSGGNYWSDYEDRYPDAKEIDESGIWDTPYVIDENNRDNYPMVPEFPTWTSILLILILLTVAVAIYKRRLFCCS
jgi:parallel beta-helix repeat protein